MDDESIKKNFPKNYERLLRLRKQSEKLIKKYWDIIKSRDKYKDPDWWRK